MSYEALINKLSALSSYADLTDSVEFVQAGLRMASFDFKREMLTIAKRNDGLYQNASQGKTALEYALKYNDYPDESEAWARTLSQYDRRQMRSMAVVDKTYNRVYYFLIDRAGVVAWTNSKLRSDGTLPKSRRLKYERTALNVEEIAKDDAPTYGAVIEGTYEVVGEIYSTKMSRGRPSMLLEVVKDNRLFRLFGPITKSMLTKGGGMPSSGKKVRFKAEVKRSTRDREFGFFTPVAASEVETGQVPTGSWTVKHGVIMEVWDYKGDYDWTTKMKIQTSGPNGKQILVSGTVPASVLRRVDRNSDLVGKSISFEATFKPSNNDPAVGWYSRPKNVSFASVANLLVSGRDEITPDIQEAVSELVIRNPMEDWMTTSFEDGEVEVERIHANLGVTWTKTLLADVTEVDFLIKSQELTDKAFYDFVHEAYENGQIYKADLNRLLNFDSLYTRSPYRSIEFEAREGDYRHNVTLMVNTYPKYKLHVRYDDEDEVRVFDLQDI
jgi:hypothetical protein